MTTATTGNVSAKLKESFKAGTEKSNWKKSVAKNARWVALGVFAFLVVIGGIVWITSDDATPDSSSNASSSAGQGVNDTGVTGPSIPPVQRHVLSLKAGVPQSMPRGNYPCSTDSLAGADVEDVSRKDGTNNDIVYTSKVDKTFVGWTYMPVNGVCDSSSYVSSGQMR